jgi:hypothetical protein
MYTRIDNQPVEGSTYSLFAGSDSTEEYYHKIGELADYFIQRYGPEENLLTLTGRVRNSRRKLKKWAKAPSSDGIKSIIGILSAELSYYTSETEKYINSVSWIDKMRDPGLVTTKEQYHLTMLEVEIVNRINKKRFNLADRKIALLPHCLRDFSRICRSEKYGFDMVCEKCSLQCYIHALNDLFEKHQVEPYIWMEGSFRKLFFEMKRKNKVLGIVGIACLAELKAGMEKCLKYDIPALGIPLNANRCARWMGDFYPNSVNLAQVEKLLK